MDIGLGWPLNFHFVFDLMVVASVATFVLSFFLPKSIERKRESPPINTVASETDNTEEPSPNPEFLPANESSVAEVSRTPNNCSKDNAADNSSQVNTYSTGLTVTDCDRLTIRTMS